jgi:hypothetical protein
MFVCSITILHNQLWAANTLLARYDQMIVTDWHGIAKDFVVPAVSPLVAALAIVAAIWKDRQARLDTRQDELARAATALFRDVALARQMYEILGLQLAQSESVESARWPETQAALDRVYAVLLGQPVVYDYYARALDKEQRSQLVILLSELRVRYKSFTPRDGIDHFILFGIYSLLSLYETRPTERAEHSQCLDAIEASHVALYTPLRLKATRSSESL